MIPKTLTMMQTLYIVRGLPGSGKSTYAKKIAAELSIAHYEADMYFMVDGVYKFDRFRLGAAHEWCFRQVDCTLHERESVIVSNTFTKWSEMDEYVHSGLWHGAQVKIIECTGEYGSVHGVPEETMIKMKARWVPNNKLPGNAADPGDMKYFTQRFPAFKAIEFLSV